MTISRIQVEGYRFVKIGTGKSGRKRSLPLFTIAGACAVIAVLGVLTWLTQDKWSGRFQPLPSQKLRSAEKLMIKGNYEHAFPMLLEVAGTRLNDDDATRLVGDLCDIADISLSDDRLPKEVGLVGATPPWQLAMEAALQPNENRPSKFALAKAHCRAAQVLNTASQLDLKYFQGLSQSETSVCLARRVYVLARRAINFDGDVTKAESLSDEALRHAGSADPVVTAKCWLEKALRNPGGKEQEQWVNNAQAFLPVLMNADDSESARAAVQVLGITRHDYLQIPVLESMIDRSHSRPLSHADRTTLHLMSASSPDAQAPLVSQRVVRRQCRATVADAKNER